MRKSANILKLGMLFLLFTAFQCDDITEFPTCDERISQLNEIEITIRNFANTSVCDARFECRYLALGNKTCGGPWSYLVYSSSIDTLQLSSLVKKFNELEKTFNRECNQISDCAMVNPPHKLECKNNRCIAIY